MARCQYPNITINWGGSSSPGFGIIILPVISHMATTNDLTKDADVLTHESRVTMAILTGLVASSGLHAPEAYNQWYCFLGHDLLPTMRCCTSGKYCEDLPPRSVPCFVCSARRRGFVDYSVTALHNLAYTFAHHGQLAV